VTVKPKNQVVIDYITMTSKIHSQQQVKELLGMSNAEFIPICSYFGYQNCDYCNGVRIHWSNTDKVKKVNQLNNKTILPPCQHLI
jgi:hypothetical protein